MKIVTLSALAQLQQYLPARACDAHKGDFGTVLVIGGSPGMAGAALMAAMAAQRVGAGKVIIATHVVHADHLVVNWPSIMAHGVADAQALQPLLAQASHLIVGPGLGQSAWAEELFAAALNSRLPLVLDADGLNLLAKQPMMRDHWILTPHMGEAARLLNCTVLDVQAERAWAVQALQKKYAGHVVLKGAHTLIADEDPAIFRCESGNPGMASAGMGDILSGVIAGLAGQGLSLSHAAQLGVMVHAYAGDEAAKQGMRGMVATDLLPFIRQAVNF